MNLSLNMQRILAKARVHKGRVVIRLKHSNTIRAFAARGMLFTDKENTERVLQELPKRLWLALIAPLDWEWTVRAVQLADEYFGVDYIPRHIHTCDEIDDAREAFGWFLVRRGTHTARLMGEGDLGSTWSFYLKPQEAQGLIQLGY